MLLARQPIFDNKDHIFGYELLYREEGANEYKSDDGDMATSSVMSASFLSLEVSHISGKKKAFINFTKNMLLHEVATLFPKDEIVVEVLEDIEPSEDVITACRNLKEDGYILALDDFIFRPGYEKLVELADIIKIDFLLTKTESERRAVVKRFQNGRIRFLAEKVENYEDFQMAKNAGYSLFQGYYFSKPVIESTKGIPPSKINHVTLINTLQNSAPEFRNIASIIEKDVAFSYEILRIANTGYYYRGNKVTSVRQAVVRMGLEELKKWALITVLRKFGGESKDAIVNLCAQRAKALELLAHKQGWDAQKTEFYTLGLFSMIDVLSGCPMELILRELSITEEIKEVLYGTLTEGNMYICYEVTLAYEKGDWEKVLTLTQKNAINIEHVAKASFEAIAWVDRT